MLKNILISLISIVVSILSSLVALKIKKTSEKQDNIFLGLSSGLLLGIAFLEILPEVFEKDSGIRPFYGVLAIIIGLIIIFIVDRLVEKKEEKAVNKGAILLFLAIAIHNIPEGLAVGLSFSGGINLSMFVSIMIHEVIDGVLTTISLLSLNLDKKRTFIYSCLVALLLLPGILVGIISSLNYSIFTVFMLGITFSCLVYVTSREILPKSIKKTDSTIFMIVGIAISLVLKILL